MPGSRAACGDGSHVLAARATIVMPCGWEILAMLKEDYRFVRSISRSLSGG